MAGLPAPPVSSANCLHPSARLRSTRAASGFLPSFRAVGNRAAASPDRGTGTLKSKHHGKGQRKKGTIGKLKSIRLFRFSGRHPWLPAPCSFFLWPLLRAAERNPAPELGAACWPRPARFARRSVPSGERSFTAWASKGHPQAVKNAHVSTIFQCSTQYLPGSPPMTSRCSLGESVGTITPETSDLSSAPRAGRPRRSPAP